MVVATTNKKLVIIICIIFSLMFNLWLLIDQQYFVPLLLWRPIKSKWKKPTKIAIGIKISFSVGFAINIRTLQCSLRMLKTCFVAKIFLFPQSSALKSPSFITTINKVCLIVVIPLLTQFKCFPWGLINSNSMLFCCGMRKEVQRQTKMFFF